MMRLSKHRLKHIIIPDVMKRRNFFNIIGISSLALLFGKLLNLPKKRFIIAIPNKSGKTIILYIDSKKLRSDLDDLYINGTGMEKPLGILHTK